MFRKALPFSLAVILTVFPVHGAINMFRSSLPAQAGVNSVFVFDTWDHIVTPAFYARQKDDAVSTIYTPDQYDRKTFVMGGRNTIGIPLYWAVGLKNERNKTQNYDAAQQATFESNVGEAHYRLSLGTKIGGFGFGLIGEYLDNSIMRKDTADGLLYSAGAETEDKTPNRYRAGINLGHSSEKGHVWSLGAAVRQNGGTFNQTAAGSINAGTLPATLVGGALRRPQNTLYADVSTFGWLKLTERGDRVYWRGNFSHQIRGDVNVKRTTGSTVLEAKLDEDDNQGDFYLGYAMAWPLSDTARFYFGPEIGATYSGLSTYAQNGANGFTGGVLGFTGNSQRLQENTRTIAGKVNLPIVFQLPVVANVLALQAGWYPEITVYSETAREQTDNFADPAKRLDTKNTRYFQANVEKYGAGLTYTPVNRLKIHLLFTTIMNSDAVGQTDRVDISRVSVGVDYVFASEINRTETTQAAPAQTEAEPAAKPAVADKKGLGGKLNAATKKK